MHDTWEMQWSNRNVLFATSKNSFLCPYCFVLITHTHKWREKYPGNSRVTVQWGSVWMQCKYNICPCDDDVPAIDPNWYESSQFFFSILSIVTISALPEPTILQNVSILSGISTQYQQIFVECDKNWRRSRTKTHLHACMREKNKQTVIKDIWLSHWQRFQTQCASLFYARENFGMVSAWLCDVCLQSIGSCVAQTHTQHTLAECDQQTSQTNKNANLQLQILDQTCDQTSMIRHIHAQIVMDFIPHRAHSIRFYIILIFFFG